MLKILRMPLFLTAFIPQTCVWFPGARRMRHALHILEESGHIYWMFYHGPDTKLELLHELSLVLTMFLYSGYYFYSDLGKEGGTLSAVSGR